MSNNCGEKDDLPTTEEEQAARQEQYYWHILMEFHALVKVFGTAIVLADLKKIKEQVDGVIEQPRIILPS